MLLAVVSAGFLLAGAESPLVGQWESVERSRGGVGRIVEFRGDGSLGQISAAMGDATYRVEGAWLVTSWADPETGETSEMLTEIGFEGGDTLIEKGEGDAETRMSRIGEAGKRDPPIVGRWCYEYLPGVNALREFTRDGRMFWRLPLEPRRGRYIAAGDLLTVELDGAAGKAFTYRIEKDRLTLVPKEGGAEQRFRKAQTTLLTP